MRKRKGKSRGQCEQSISIAPLNCNTNQSGKCCLGQQANSKWKLRKGLKFQEDAYGFVYKITNKSNGKWYIGQKKLDKKGQWKTYNSSSNKLKAEIKELGEEQFAFEILEFVDCKWMLNYLELYYQIILEAMFDENSYNGIVNVRLRKFESMKEKWKKITPSDRTVV